MVCPTGVANAPSLSGRYKMLPVGTDLMKKRTQKNPEGYIYPGAHRWAAKKLLAVILAGLC